jgi:cytochrome c oxidase subunit 2
VLLAMVFATTVVAGACSSGGDTTTTPAARGKAVAMRAGCTSCHGATSIRALGPTWNGLAGSTVKLDDGSTVVADTAYLVESIRAPAAKKVAGYTGAMPVVQLSDDDVIALVAYIGSLAVPSPTTASR